MKNEWTRDNCWKVRGAAGKGNISIDVLEYLISSGKIESQNGLIRKEDVNRIVENRKSYITFFDYAMQKKKGKFLPEYIRNRNALWEYMEENEFWGIRIYRADEMLFTLPDSQNKYISINDIDKLDEKIEMFIRLYDLDIIEQIQIILESSVKDKRVKTTFLEFVQIMKELEPKYYTKALIGVSKRLGEYETFIFSDEPSKIEEVIRSFSLKREQILFTKYYSYLKKKGMVKIKAIKFEKKEKKGVKAYDCETYSKLAKCIFNEKSIAENKMVEKALDNSFFAEMWMFWACFFVDGWRGDDTCESWIYPRLDENKFINEFSLDTLYEDILYGRITEKQYGKVARYCLKVCELEAQNTIKTGEKTKGILLPAIREENLPFYGRLELIAEVHHIKNGEGYMKCARMGRYRNKYIMRSFFGPEFYDALDGENGQIRRMNKSFLQAGEMVSRKNGHSPMVAQTIVSLARNHSNVDSISTYLSDHSIDGECADIVLSMLIERGVMGTHIYQALKDSYPDSFNKLSSEEQTKLISSVDLAPLDIEIGGDALLLSERIKELFKKGASEEKVSKILNSLYEIGNGNGLAKDKGVFCIRRALGEICEHGKFASCIANDCPYLVFTKYGIDSLLDVISMYFRKYEETKNIKYLMVLKKIIIPKYKNVILTIMKSLSKEEQSALLQYLEVKNG